LSQRESQKFYEERALFGVARPEDLPPSKGRDLTAEMGLNTRTCAALNKTGPWLDGLFGQHPNAVDIILPIMAHSLTLGRTLNALKSKFNASLSVLDALGIGVFLVSATGEIMEHNQEAKDILAQNDGLGMTRSKRFYLNKYEETAELDRMITDANKLLDGEVTSLNSLLNVSRPSGVFVFLLSVHALSDSQAELENGFKCAFVTVIDPARKNVLTADGIAALCDLTFSETEVVKLVIQGIRPAEVAARRSVSVNTVKPRSRVSCTKPVVPISQISFEQQPRRESQSRAARVILSSDPWCCALYQSETFLCIRGRLVPSHRRTHSPQVRRKIF
jgi:hypothetical protein